jgi:hypothetical protein
MCFAEEIDKEYWICTFVAININAKKLDDDCFMIETCRGVQRDSVI